MKASRKPRTNQVSQSFPLLVAPGLVLKGESILGEGIEAVSTLGKAPMMVCGTHTESLIEAKIKPMLEQKGLKTSLGYYSPDCAEISLDSLKKQVEQTKSDVVIGIGGGKAMDTAKLLAYHCQLPAVTVPTNAATCAAWTALSNIYSPEGAFQRDVPLPKCPELLILDYELIRTAPPRTLVAGIGDAIAKWYEASVSSGDSTSTLTIAAVQQARVLRDILFQKSQIAVENPQTEAWSEVVDATVLLAGVIGGLGGAACRTVAAHAVHNGLTHLRAAHGSLHGEKVSYGILVQLRLEEMIAQNHLATTAREQLLQFYTSIGLPKNLEDLGLGGITIAELRLVAEIVCQPDSDLHRLPFTVSPEQLMGAMVSTTAKIKA